MIEVVLMKMPNVAALRQFAQNIMNACDEYDRSIQVQPDEKEPQGDDVSE